MAYNAKGNTFDLIVIGTGAAASTVAYKCNSTGWKVAVIDSRPFGGTCALRGCDPKKVLVGAAEVIDWDNRMKDRGVGNASIKESNYDLHINWSDLMCFKRSFTEPVPKNREEAFSKAEIAAFHGTAQFIGPTAVMVYNNSNNNNKKKTIHSKCILIATGAKPAKLNIIGEESMTTSDQFLELEELPANIVFVGGGYISFEFAHIAARAGSKVTVLHRGEKPLNKFDPDLVDMLIKRTENIGIDVRLQTKVEKVEIREKEERRKFVVHTSSSNNNGKKDIIETDIVVHGAGRVPEIENLNLQAANVEYDKKTGIKVNEFLQSISNQAIYAAGDAAATNGMPLTPVAGYEAGIVAANLLKGNHLKPDYKGIPSVVFTIPPLASVGLQEKEAKKQGLKFKTNFQDTSTWYSSRRVNESCSGFKMLVQEGTNYILGAHLLGPQAEEVINIFALAIRLGLNADKIKEGILAYPTHSYDISYML